jgi:hypothetical protein
LVFAAFSAAFSGIFIVLEMTLMPENTALRLFISVWLTAPIIGAQRTYMIIKVIKPTMSFIQSAVFRRLTGKYAATAAMADAVRIFAEDWKGALAL